MKKTAGGFGLCLQHLWLASTVVLRDSDSSLTRSRNLEEEPLPHCSQFLYCLERTPQENDSSLADSQEGLTSIDHPLWFFLSSGHLRQNRFKQPTESDIPWLSQQQVVVVSHSLPDPPPTHRAMHRLAQGLRGSDVSSALALVKQARRFPGRCRCPTEVVHILSEYVPEAGFCVREILLRDSSHS